MTRSNAGGGHGSRQVTERPVKTGAGSRVATPGGVGQLGQSQGSHVTRGQESNYRGEPLHGGRSFNPTKFGNELATNVGRGGPGAGRVCYGQSGSQGMHGATNPGNPRPVPSGHMIESYGPESSRPRNPGRDDREADF